MSGLIIYFHFTVGARAAKIARIQVVLLNLITMLAAFP
jgi:hypothetical protein